MKNKNSDSDYKAEDEGSATDGKDKKKIIKKNPQQAVVFSKLNKKQLIQQSINSFLPEGVTLTKDKNMDAKKYEQLILKSDAAQFSLNYKIFLGKIVKVIDGDTIKAIILLNINDEYTKFTFRLNGIDTPQTRKGDVKQFGKKVKQIINNMLQNKIVKIQAGDFDKYGRILSRIYAFDQNKKKQFCINDFLIENDLAKIYHGKTKVQFNKEDFQNFQQKWEGRQWPVVGNYPLQNL